MLSRQRLRDRREVRAQRRAAAVAVALRSDARRCAGCGKFFKQIVPGCADVPELLAMHLAASPDCVEVYCRDPDNLVDLDVGKLGIRQTMFICRYAGGSGVAGIAPCGERRVFYFDPQRAKAEAWLRERVELE